MSKFVKVSDNAWVDPDKVAAIIRGESRLNWRVVIEGGDADYGILTSYTELSELMAVLGMRVDD